MSTLDRSIFDTRSVEPQERFAVWRDSINVVFDAKIDMRITPTRFHAQVDATALGQIVLGRITSETQSFERPPQKILTDGLDSYIVQVFTKGHCEVQDGRTVRQVRSGDIYIIDASAPLQAVDYGFQTVSAVIPRNLLSRRLVSADGHHRRVIPRETALGKLLYGFILSLDANRADMTLDEGLASIEPLLSLTESILNARSEQASVSLDDAAIDFAVVNAVLDFIDDNLGDPALSPEMIASALGLSRSRLYRLFHHLDGIASEIRRRRLRKSLHDLLNAGQRGLQVSEIAYRWGFNSDSDYIRAFKRQYGLTPGQAKVARSAVLASDPQQDKTATEQSYDAWIRAFAR